VVTLLSPPLSPVKTIAVWPAEARVHGVVAHVEEERLVPVAADELDGLEVHAVDEVLPPGQATGDLAVEVVGMEVASAADAAVLGDDGLVEAVRPRGDFLRAVVRVAGEVPLADNPGGVAGRPERLGDGDVVGGEVLRVVGAEVVGDAHAGGPLPRHQGGAVRRADRRGGVGVGEAHAVAGETVQVGRLVERVAVAAQLRVAQVVGQDEDDVALARRSGRRPQRPPKQRRRGARTQRLQERPPRGPGMPHAPLPAFRFLACLPRRPPVRP